MNKSEAPNITGAYEYLAYKVKLSFGINKSLKGIVKSTSLYQPKKP